jgi:MoaA/NifB/PqqE/SkfB family radical SAM enzyme
MKIHENKNWKILNSPNYNFLFNKNTGFFARWGKTKDEDPEYSPYGPEIADIEISSANLEDVKNSTSDMIITNGGCNGKFCKKFCYKLNTSDKTTHMSLDTFKKVLDRFNKNLTQIAFGLCDLNSHPQVWDIFKETNKRGFASNVTINGQDITDEQCKKLSLYCGAVAVSINKGNKEEAYNTIKRLSQDNNMKQINIHIVLAEDTIPFIKEVIEDMKSDERLSSMNALVMLSYKDKGKTGCYSPIKKESYRKLIEFCEEKQIRFGFDSCSAPLYIKAIEDRNNKEELEQYAEPCESGMFSIYISCNAKIYQCSFGEGIDEWKEGINILDYSSIIDIWHSPKMLEWRKKLLDNKRTCPIYNLG